MRFGGAPSKYGAGIAVAIGGSFARGDPDTEPAASASTATGTRTLDAFTTRTLAFARYRAR